MMVGANVSNAFFRFQPECQTCDTVRRTCDSLTTRKAVPQPPHLPSKPRPREALGASRMTVGAKVSNTFFRLWPECRICDTVHRICASPNTKKSFQKPSHLAPKYRPQVPLQAPRMAVGAKVSTTFFSLLGRSAGFATLCTECALCRTQGNRSKNRRT